MSRKKELTQYRDRKRRELATSAPAWASARAVSIPIPEAAPVTTAV